MDQDRKAHEEMCSRLATSSGVTKPAAICEKNQLDYIYGGTYAKMAALGELTSSDAGPLIDDCITVKLRQLQEQWCVHQDGTAKYRNLPGTDELPPCASPPTETWLL
ncbi:MAG: hypothetical protein CL854_07260 [Cryomorphaceae bacterium]|mgnify:FL=1|nr:hypothetical protein [Cryomorphaceae bacterium]